MPTSHQRAFSARRGIHWSASVLFRASKKHRHDDDLVPITCTTVIQKCQPCKSWCDSYLPDLKRILVVLQRTPLVRKGSRLPSFKRSFRRALPCTLAWSCPHLQTCDTMMPTMQKLMYMYVADLKRILVVLQRTPPLRKGSRLPATKRDYSNGAAQDPGMVVPINRAPEPAAAPEPEPTEADLLNFGDLSVDDSSAAAQVSLCKCHMSNDCVLQTCLDMPQLRLWRTATDHGTSGVVARHAFCNFRAGACLNSLAIHKKVLQLTSYMPQARREVSSLSLAGNGSSNRESGKNLVGLGSCDLVCDTFYTVFTYLHVMCNNLIRYE